MTPAPRTEQGGSLVLTALIISFAFLMETLDNTILIAALPAVAEDFGVAPLRVNLAVTIYLVTLAAMIPASSWFADRFGARRTFLWAIFGFMVASVGAALSTSLTMLVGMRVLQATAGSMMTPVGRLLLFFGLPSVGVSISAFWVIWITLTLILSAFAEEIFWAGLEAIPAGQWEAARSTGMTQPQALRDVVLPQAFKICVPQLTNRTIGITKNTALGTAIGMPELLNEAQTALSFSGNATPLLMAAVGYLIIFLPLMAIAGYLERSMTWGKKA